MIFVFKTSVKNKKQVKQLTPYLNTTVPNAKWNFDLEDIDNILRIDNEDDCVKAVVDLLQTQHYRCEELE